MPLRRMGSDVTAPPALTPAIDGSGWPYTRATLSSGKQPPDTHWTAGWVGPTAGPGVTYSEHSFGPARNIIETRRSARRPVAMQIVLSRLPMDLLFEE
jgi:hypothetical protein